MHVTLLWRLHQKPGINNICGSATLCIDIIAALNLLKLNLKIFYPDNRVQQNKRNQGQNINSKGHTPEGNVGQNVLQRSLKKIQIVACEPTLCPKEASRWKEKQKQHTYQPSSPKTTKCNRLQYRIYLIDAQNVGWIDCHEIRRIYTKCLPVITTVKRD